MSTFSGEDQLFVLFNITAFADSTLPKLQPVKGSKYTSEWRGTFKVTKCIICEESKLSNSTEIMKLVEIGFDFATVPQDQLPDCAKTDLAMIQYFKHSSDDGLHETVMGKSYGMCDWSATRNYQFLDLSDEFFHYRKQTRDFTNTILSEESFTIDKTADNKYLVHRIVEERSSNGRQSKKSVYFFEAEKIDSKPHGNFLPSAKSHTAEWVK